EDAAGLRADRVDVVGAVGDVDRAFVLERLALGGELRRGGFLADLGDEVALQFVDVFGVDFVQGRVAVVGEVAAVGCRVVAEFGFQFGGGEFGCGGNRGDRAGAGGDGASTAAAGRDDRRQGDE